MSFRVGSFLLSLLILGIVLSTTTAQQQSTPKPSSRPRPIERPKTRSQGQISNPRATTLPQRQRGRQQARPRTQQPAVTPSTMGSSNMTVTPPGMMSSGTFSHAEFLARAEMFFKNATRGVGMTKRGSDAAWNILVKYSAVDEVDTTRKISAEEEKRRREMAQKMKDEIRKTLSESDRKKLADLERGLKSEIDKRLKTQANEPEIDPIMVEPMEK